MSPNIQIAALLFSAFFAFVLILYVKGILIGSSVTDTINQPGSNGVLQPYRSLGWWQWMYRVSPFSYLIEGLLGNGE